ncbi:hypothetical protein [Lysobacter capsici]|uniref:hypothetical protein n=1 Tax=Lysobacter capsici TaxID=435897 RepID=UPI001C0043C8|nr:hypothetical protein [Lysobacter capsici]QWF18006.1 hypothetical protein KME82_04305 [Lysobacter capsici]
MRVLAKNIASFKRYLRCRTNAGARDERIGAPSQTIASDSAKRAIDSAIAAHAYRKNKNYLQVEIRERGAMRIDIS